MVDDSPTCNVQCPVGCSCLNLIYSGHFFRLSSAVGALYAYVVMKEMTLEAPCCVNVLRGSTTLRVKGSLLYLIPSGLYNLPGNLVYLVE